MIKQIFTYIRDFIDVNILGEEVKQYSKCGFCGKSVLELRRWHDGYLCDDCVDVKLDEFVGSLRLEAVSSKTPQYKFKQEMLRKEVAKVLESETGKYENMLINDDLIGFLNDDINRIIGETRIKHGIPDNIPCITEVTVSREDPNKLMINIIG